jgi:hypothetical protein
LLLRWRNWYTRMAQDHVAAMPWGFESPSEHWIEPRGGRIS